MPFTICVSSVTGLRFIMILLSLYTRMAVCIIPYDASTAVMFILSNLLFTGHPVYPQLLTSKAVKWQFLRNFDVSMHWWGCVLANSKEKHEHPLRLRVVPCGTRYRLYHYEGFTMLRLADAPVYIEPLGGFLLTGRQKMCHVDVKCRTAFWRCMHRPSSCNMYMNQQDAQNSCN